MPSIRVSVEFNESCFYCTNLFDPTVKVFNRKERRVSTKTAKIVFLSNISNRIR